jgi:hypothetical protein
MPNNSDSPSPALGELLGQALDRSVETSLSSLETLRDAVRAYTRNEKNRGMPLDTVMRGISTALMEMEDERVSGDGMSPRDPKLARQLRAWCSEHYVELG